MAAPSLGLEHVFEIEKPSEDSIKIGRFYFFNPSFQWACQQLENAYNRAYRWLIVDEYGKLEMKGSGLNPYLDDLIHKIGQGGGNQKLLVVVRDYLLDEFVGRFSAYDLHIIPETSGLDELVDLLEN